MRRAGEMERALTSGEPTPIGRRWQVGAEAKLAGTAEKTRKNLAVVEEVGRGHAGLAPCVRRGRGAADAGGADPIFVQFGSFSEKNLF